MKLKRLTLAAVGLTLGASPALSAPVVDAFVKVCADNHADFPAVRAALDAGGWKPTEVMPTTLESISVTESVARAQIVGGKVFTVFAWHGSKGAIQVSACTLRAHNTKFAEVAPDAQTWVAVAPLSTDSGKAIYHFTQTANGRKAVAKSEANTAAAGAGLEFFTVSSDNQDTILDLLKIKS